METCCTRQDALLFQTRCCIRQGAVLKRHAVQETQEEDEDGFRRRERYVGKWERRFQLPENVSATLMLLPCKGASCSLCLPLCLY